MSSGLATLTIDERLALLPDAPARDVVHRMPWTRHAALTATPHAIDRLRAWYAAGRLERHDDSRDVIKRRLPYFGDVEMLPAVLNAVIAMVAPARDFLLKQTVIISTGWSTRGWTGSALPCHGKPRLIVLSGKSRDERQVHRTMLHEAAHVWLEPTPARLLSGLDQLEFEASLETSPYKAEVDELVAAVEQRANELAAVWSHNA